MKKLLPVLFFLLLVVNIQAQTGRDTLSSFYAGPGILYTKLSIPSGPWIVNVLEIDPKNPALKIEAHKSNDLVTGNLEGTSSMASRYNYEGHYVIGAVNGDFFSGNNILQMLVQNGEILHRQRTDGAYASVAFDVNNAIEFASPAFSGSASTSQSNFAITGVNESRTADKLTMYNSLYGTSTKTGSGTEVALHPQNGEWFVNDTVYCVVDSVRNSGGNMMIAKGGVVLSGTGTTDTFLSSVKAGDIVRIYTKATGRLKKLKELIGGHPFFMKNGVISPSIDLNDPMLKDRNPRTLIGINKDTTRIFIVVIDGRSTTSAGMTVWEMVDFMKSIGVTEAMNFDGGGSTTMVVRNSIVNSPSDGSERAVAGSLMIVSTRRAGSATRLNIIPKKIRLYKAEQVRFGVTGSDSIDNPVTLTASSIQYSLKANLGTVDASGKFTAGSVPGSGYLYVKYNNLTDSAYITIKPLSKIILSPKAVTIDTTKTVQISPRGYDTDNIARSVTSSEVVWKALNPSVAVVDSNGLVSGKSEGKAKITATYMNTLSDTAEVTVQIGKGLSVLDQMENAAGFTLSGLNVDTSFTKISISNSNKSQGNGSLKIDYKFTYLGTGNFVYLNTDIPVYGVPDSLFIDTRSDSTAHKISFLFSDDNGEMFRLNGYGYINTAGYFNTIPVPLKNFAPLGSGTFYYPIRITKIEIQLQYNTPNRIQGQVCSGAIYLDNLRIKYPGSTVGVEEERSMAREFSLKQNYPNPFNPSTVIEFSLVQQGNVTLRVYDMLGREVASLVNENLSAGVHKAVWNAVNNSSGVYFYRIQSGNNIETRKMLLIR